MTDYIDTYVSGPVQADLETFARNFVNQITVTQGVAATEEVTNADGVVTPAQAAKGDPALWYTCIRTTFSISASIQSPLAVVDDATGKSVVGVWA
jgi:hypothetical protein